MNFAQQLFRRLWRTGPPGAAVALVGLLALAGCSSSDAKWHGSDLTGAMPDLAFTMTRAEDGKTVTADDFRGKVALLYFGYTFCPDVCPTTLSNLAVALKRLGDKADDVRVLFVTVDPNRDTLPVLKEYAAAFSPQIVGLRGAPDQLAALAKRYRVAYSVTPAKGDTPYTVTHSSAIYAFDASGKIRLLISSMATNDPDIDGTAADLRRLVDEASPPGFFQRLVNMI
jgi:protein SCO1/2